MSFETMMNSFVAVWTKFLTFKDTIADILFVLAAILLILIFLSALFMIVGYLVKTVFFFASELIRRLLGYEKTDSNTDR